jgi:hypothetical protein
MLDTSDDGPTSVSKVTQYEMFPFLAITVKMGHCIQDQLTNYWQQQTSFTYISTAT